MTKGEKSLRSAEYLVLGTEYQIPSTSVRSWRIGHSIRRLRTRRGLSNRRYENPCRPRSSASVRSCTTDTTSPAPAEPPADRSGGGSSSRSPPAPPRGAPMLRVQPPQPPQCH